MEPASFASTRYDKPITTSTLRSLGRVLNRIEVYVSLVTGLFHVFEELINGETMASTADDGAMKLRVKPLVLVADVLSQVVFPKEGLLTMFATATNEYMLVFSRTPWPS
jgi:hypothetical protein